MANREDSRRAMERRLYDAAIDLFCDQGFKKTTLVDIAAEAGVSTRTLYKYFPTKDSILQRFCKENILSLKAFASSLPADMPLEDRVIEIMVQDFKYMFCLFDPSYILHTARDEGGLFRRFELKNIFETESIYATLFKRAQVGQGIESNVRAVKCASVVMGLYRHCGDLYRFRWKGEFDEGMLRSYFKDHIGLVWESIESELFSREPAEPIDSANRRLFSLADD